MMENNLYLEVVTPEKIIFSGNVALVHLPGSAGSFTILRNHAPIVAALKNGEIRVEGLDGREYLFECESGVVECLRNKVTVLIEK
jgi:F-type H+-transporting ATPase subunit epsilon